MRTLQGVRDGFPLAFAQSSSALSHWDIQLCGDYGDETVTMQNAEWQPSEGFISVSVSASSGPVTQTVAIPLCAGRWETTRRDERQAPDPHSSVGTVTAVCTVDNAEHGKAWTLWRDMHGLSNEVITSSPASDRISTNCFQDHFEFDDDSPVNTVVCSSTCSSLTWNNFGFWSFARGVGLNSKQSAENSISSYILWLQ